MKSLVFDFGTQELHSGEATIQSSVKVEDFFWKCLLGKSIRFHLEFSLQDDKNLQELTKKIHQS